MFTFLKSISSKQFLTEEVPTLGLSILIAELFFKFHSFTLECAAFLCAWTILGAARKFLSTIFKRRPVIPGRESGI